MMAFSDFDSLVLFTRIVEAGGLAAAERATGVPKATLSRRLSRLETALNVQLAHRSRKGIVLTEQGRQLFERSRAALQIAEEGVSEVQGDRAALSGTVRLSLPPDIATAILAPALIQFQATHPGVRIEMTLADRRVSLIEEGYDLVVRMGSLATSDLLSRKVATLPRILVASREFLALHSTIDLPDKLETLPALAIRRDLTSWTLVAADGRTITVNPSTAFSANRQTILVEAAIAGLGIANLPVFLVSAALAAGTLERVLPAWTPAPVEMTALWQRDRVSSRLVQAIVAQFVQACASSDIGVLTT